MRIVLKLYLNDENSGRALICPICEEEWSYGWSTVAELRSFLDESEIFACAGCENMFSSSQIDWETVIEGQ